MIPTAVVKVCGAVPLVTQVRESDTVAQGPIVKRFDDAFVGIVGVEHAIAENSGTTARFADIREDDFCIDPDAVAAATNPRTKVLMAVHPYGQMADMSKLASLAEEYGLGCCATKACGPVTGTRCPATNNRTIDLHAAVGISRLVRLGELTAQCRRAFHGTRGRPRPQARMAPSTPCWSATRPGSLARTGRGTDQARYRQRDPLPRMSSPTTTATASLGVVAAKVPVARKAALQALSLPVHSKFSDADVAIVSTVREVLGA